MKRSNDLFLLLLVFSFFSTNLADGAEDRFPESIPKEILLEPVPAAFRPIRVENDAFEVVWEKGGHGLEATISEESVEWVRLTEVIALPRARLRIKAIKGTQGVITSGYGSQAFHEEEDGAYVEIPVALLDINENRIEVIYKNQGKQILDTLRLRLKKGSLPAEKRVFIDASCSPYGVKANQVQLAESDWGYVGCRLITLDGEYRGRANLELYVFWNHPSTSLSSAGVTLKPYRPNLWLYRLSPKPGTLQVTTSNGGTFELSYKIPDPLHFGSLAAGVGPYIYRFEESNSQVLKSKITPIVTLYGSYFITQSVKVVAFDATSVSRKWFTDFGVYLHTQSIKTIDGRLSLHVLLGGHVIAFKDQQELVFRPRLPQGIEAIFREAGCRGCNVSLGGFFYPPINQISYYNTWLRWGAARLFGEVNYISWQERGSGGLVNSDSLGVTFGFPLFQFL